MARGRTRTLDEKLEIVKECLIGEISVRKCARKYQTTPKTINKWMQRYETQGTKGLTPCIEKKTYPFETKILAVTECLNGKTSKGDCARKLGASMTAVTSWIRLYETRGIEGLKAKTEVRRYSVEVRARAVNDYLSGGGSLSNICKKYDISSTSLLEKWIKRYNSHGTFKERNSGGASTMTKGRNTTLEERIEIVRYCIANNKDYGKTVKQYNVSYQQVHGWVGKYEGGGIDSLVDRRGKRKDESQMTEVEKLRAQIKLKEAENQRLQMENDLLKKLEEIERRRSRS